MASAVFTPVVVVTTVVLFEALVVLMVVVLPMGSLVVAFVAAVVFTIAFVSGVVPVGAAERVCLAAVTGTVLESVDFGSVGVSVVAAVTGVAYLVVVAAAAGFLKTDSGNVLAVAVVIGF